MMAAQVSSGNGMPSREALVARALLGLAGGEHLAAGR